jgi:hypothetical protein
LRPDKKPKDADTLDTIRALLGTDELPEVSVSKKLTSDG